MRRFFYSLIVAICMIGCENRALHDSEEFRPREIHERIEFHFDRVEVDGIEYLILEKDNNNPHEGFGFMAFRANRLMEKQDSIIAYVKTIKEMQTLIYAKLYGVSDEAASNVTDQILNGKMQEQLGDILRLEQTKLSGRVDSIPPQ